MFLNLLAAREAHGVMYKAGAMTPAERAWCISRATGEPLTKVLEFKRIYITFWKFAISREKSVEDVKQFCSLFKENERACPREPAENAAELLAVQQEAERAEEEKIAKQKESERIESLKKAKQAEEAKEEKRVEEEKEAARLEKPKESERIELLKETKQAEEASSCISSSRGCCPKERRCCYRSSHRRSS